MSKVGVVPASATVSDERSMKPSAGIGRSIQSASATPFESFTVSVADVYWSEVGESSLKWRYSKTREDSSQPRRGIDTEALNWTRGAPAVQPSSPVSMRSLRMTPSSPLVQMQLSSLGSKVTA